jgi:hypothetical protein
LVRSLTAEGHLVRGTSRSESNLAAIEDAGAEAVVADPYRLATVTPLLFGVSVVVWPFGTATGTDDEIEAVHGPRLETLLTKLVDSGVRGLVYEAAGTVPQELLDAGAAQVRASGDWFRMPVAIVDADPADTEAWKAAMVAGVDSILTA